MLKRLARFGEFSERPLGVVPRWVWGLLLCAFAAQVLLHATQRERLSAQTRPLPPPPPAALMRVLSLGDPIALSKALTLWLQAFDNQPGVSVPFRSLDYDRLIAWLDRISSLDPRSHYPLLNATRLYAAVSDAVRARKMLEFTHRKFLEAPNHRWRWLAEAALMAKHRLKDRALALRYARALTEQATGASVPYWARDMTVLILAEMGEYEAARGMVAALLAQGHIRDPHELAFLSAKLDELARLEDASGISPQPSSDGRRLEGRP